VPTRRQEPSSFKSAETHTTLSCISHCTCSRHQTWQGLLDAVKHPHHRTGKSPAIIGLPERDVLVPNQSTAQRSVAAMWVTRGKTRTSRRADAPPKFPEHFRGERLRRSAQCQKSQCSPTADILLTRLGHILPGLAEAPASQGRDSLAVIQEIWKQLKSARPNSVEYESLVARMRRETDLFLQRLEPAPKSKR